MPKDLSDEHKPEQYEVEIASRIYNCIKRKGYSYGELSNITGISKAMLQRYATGETGKIPLKRIRVIAEALNVPTNYLVWGINEPPDMVLDTPLSDTEIKLINAFRNAHPVFQQEAIDMLERHQRKEESL